MRSEDIKIHNFKLAQDYVKSKEDPITNRLLQHALGAMLVMVITDLHGERIKPEYPFDALFFVKAVEQLLWRRKELIEVLSGGDIDAMNDFPG